MTTYIRSWRGVAALTALAVLTVGLAACGDDDGGATASSAESVDSGASSGDQFQWVVVTDEAGLGDQGFNDLAYAGIERAADEFGGEAVVIESADQAQYVPNLLQAVEDDAALVVAVGFALTDAVVEVASAHPQAKFVLIDAVAVGEDGTPLGNVRSVTFREEEGAYLAGIVAAMTTRTGSIGFVGGVEIPPVQRFLAGFRAGAQSIDPDIRLDTAYIGSFADAAKGRELAANYYATGADIVFEVAGLGGLAAYEAAETAGPGHLVVSVDTCKDQVSPEHFLTSATKDVSGQVFSAAEGVVDGDFAGGEIAVGLADDGVGLCDSTFTDLPSDVQAAVDDARHAIADGSIVVPSR